jgi:hypothetical protein
MQGDIVVPQASDRYMLLVKRAGKEQCLSKSYAARFMLCGRLCGENGPKFVLLLLAAVAAGEPAGRDAAPMDVEMDFAFPPQWRSSIPFAYNFLHDSKAL